MKDKISKDDFWDIQKLIPQKTEKPKQTFSSKAPRVVEVKSGHEPSPNKDSSFSFASAMQQSEQNVPHSCLYKNLSPLIRLVKVTDWKNSYHYYEFFCKNAIFFRDKIGTPCDRVPFFSYVPQYSQMSKEQLAWFLWWRNNIRQGIYLDTDVSYILLYFYECINLGELLDTRKTLSDMIGVWFHYRDSYPQLDATVSEWLCDYSLIHQIPIDFPREDLSRDMIGHCSLREVYYTFDPHNFLLYAKFLLTYCNAYNYRKSKFYTESSAALYDQHIPSALARLLEQNREFFLDGHCHLRQTTRTAFTGALCSYRMRKKIEVEYISLSDTSLLRDVITCVIKYCENKIRAYLSIRSRLGVSELESQLTATIDSYFAEVGLHQNVGVNTSDFLPYERLYENQDKEFSIQKAMEIERSSWNTTELLVNKFDDIVSLETKKQETEIEDEDIIIKKEEIPSQKFEKKIALYSEFFGYVLRADFASQKAYCKRQGIMSDAVADFINEIAVEIFEDILLEKAVDGYVVIEDYKNLFEP